VVGLKDLKKAIHAAIKTTFPTVSLYETDVKEGFTRPSIFVTFGTMYRTDYAESFLREIPVVVNYFPSNRDDYQIEVLETQEDLEAVLRKGFVVSGRHIHVLEDMESEVVDHTLQTIFRLSYYDSEVDSSVTPPLMGELDIDG